MPSPLDYRIEPAAGVQDYERADWGQIGDMREKTLSSDEKQSETENPVKSPLATEGSFNPASGDELGRFVLSDKISVENAVEKARLAQLDWQVTSFDKRARLVMNLRKLIAKQADEIAELISLEVGKPLSECYSAELSGPLDTCVWLTDNTEKLLAEEAVALSNPLLSTKQSIITYEPLGVIGIISPWNYPFSIPMMSILMSVIVGNTVVVKPSEKASLVGMKIGKLFDEAGFPEGVVNIITGDATSGAHLASSRLAKLIFTGGVRGGQKVMASAAENVTALTLELGGKDPAIILPDAPPEWTARGLVWGALTNAGQACASIERVYIIKGKKSDKLIEKIVELTRSLKVGPASDPDTDIGPVIDSQQLRRIASLVDDACEKGARILTGGRIMETEKGNFFEPTVLMDVNHSMRIMREEIFGPVLPMMLVENEEEAIELANDSEFGLCGTVWGKNLRRAEDIARDLDTGTVLINDCLFSHAAPQLPWGGLKKSGFGRSHSRFGLLDLVNIKHINIDAAGGPARLWWFPYCSTSRRTLRGGINLFHGSFTARASGLWDFLINFMRPRVKSAPKEQDQSISPAKASENIESEKAQEEISGQAKS